MGMTLWLHTLEDREYSQDSDDHSLMHTHADALDALCDSAHVRKLSDYFDFTDMELNYGEDADPDDDEGDEESAEPALDPETGYAYGIDDMNWFEAAEGLATLQALHDAVAAGAIEELDDDDRDALIEELDDCIAAVADTATRSGKFHLAVVE
jgi:hypothetical protein